MYYVGDCSFEDLFEAIDFCKSRPATILTDNEGKVLMEHIHITLEDFLGIELAKEVLAVIN